MTNPQGKHRSEPSQRVERRRGLMSANDVAARLGVPIRWAYAQARAGRIPAVPPGTDSFESAGEDNEL